MKHVNTIQRITTMLLTLGLLMGFAPGMAKAAGNDMPGILQIKRAIQSAAAEASAAPAQATPVPTPAVTPKTPSADPVGDFVKGVKDGAFLPVTAQTHVIRNPVAISDCVTLTYDANVTIPEARAYSITQMSKRTFSEADIAKLCKLFSVPENVSEERFSTSENDFYYCRYPNAYVTRSNWMHYELDWQPEEIAPFDDPPMLTRAETQPIAEKALADMGAKGYVLESADEAMAMGSDQQGNSVAVSRGWEYVFVPQTDGLPRHDYGGGFGSDRDPIRYDKALPESVWLYIDEQGVSRVSWRCARKTEARVVNNAPLLPLSEILALANARFANMYQQNDQFKGHFNIHVLEIRLAAMVLGNSRDATETYSVPVWELEYTVTTDGNVYRDLCVLPFNAVDGGAILSVRYPY